MKLLFLDAYFEPEQIAFTHLENDLLDGFVHAGHSVEIVCPVPTRGIGKKLVHEYRKKRKEYLYNGHVRVKRFWAPQEGKNPFIRAIRYLWCNLRTYQIGTRYHDIDAVFCNSTPPTQGWIAGMVAKKHKVPFIYSLQDIFPDSLVTTGLTRRNSFLWKTGRKFENSTYRKCSRIIVISDSMKKNLQAKGVHDGLIRVVSNWIDLNAIYPISKEDNKLFDEFCIPRDDFIVLYAGNFGAAQGADIILDAAEQLQNEKKIKFVIFGAGSGYKSAEEKARVLPNVFIHPLLPQERVSEVYSMGDVILITCKKGVGSSGMPSKTWSIMACNKRIIASFDKGSDLDLLLRDTQSGECIEPENAMLLADKIREELLMRNANSGDSRKYVMERASKESCVDSYLKIIEREVMHR